MAQNDVLSALLSVEDKVEDTVYMKRFGVDFTVQALTSGDIQRIQERATFYQGKGKNREKVLNEEKFQCLIVERGTVNPNWAAPELKERYPECGTTSDIIQKRLLAGEMSILTNSILELSGFNQDEEDVKN